MAGWYNKVKDNLGNVVDAIIHFDVEFDAARKETSLKVQVLLLIDLGSYKKSKLYLNF
jgi:hypothetical protein